ncbi:MAG: hypothetical protein QM756_22175 [Polyangiaceae bacterium]
MTRDVERRLQVDPPFAIEQRRQRLPIDVLHHEVRRAVRQRADVERIDDARALDGRSRARLVQKAGVQVLVQHVFRPQNLERDRLLEQLVTAQVDEADTAHAEQAQHAVTTVDQLPNERVIDAARQRVTRRRRNRHRRNGAELARRRLSSRCGERQSSGRRVRLQVREARQRSGRRQILVRLRIQ